MTWMHALAPNSGLDQLLAGVKCAFAVHSVSQRGPVLPDMFHERLATTLLRASPDCETAFVDMKNATMNHLAYAGCYVYCGHHVAGEQCDCEEVCTCA